MLHLNDILIKSIHTSVKYFWGCKFHFIPANQKFLFFVYILFVIVFLTLFIYMQKKKSTTYNIVIILFRDKSKNKNTFYFRMDNIVGLVLCAHVIRYVEKYATKKFASNLKYMKYGFWERNKMKLFAFVVYTYYARRYTIYSHQSIECKLFYSFLGILQKGWHKNIKFKKYVIFFVSCCLWAEKYYCSRSNEL